MSSDSKDSGGVLINREDRVELGNRFNCEAGINLWMGERGMQVVNIFKSNETSDWREM